MVICQPWRLSRRSPGCALPLEELAEFPVTDLPAQEETKRKRPPRDKQANRRTAQKRSIKQFVRKTP